MGSGKPEYIEALVRLNDGNNCTIQPKAFLPAAERFGFMSKIDRWVVEKARSLLSDVNGLRLFLNLSGSSLRDQSLLD
ncbi:MAG: EAL domain-containing protein, partial [Thermodesulfobacteriota bacterium]